MGFGAWGSAMRVEPRYGWMQSGCWTCWARRGLRRDNRAEGLGGHMCEVQSLSWCVCAWVCVCWGWLTSSVYTYECLVRWAVFGACIGALWCRKGQYERLPYVCVYRPRGGMGGERERELSLCRSIPPCLWSGGKQGYIGGPTTWWCVDWGVLI